MTNMVPFPIIDGNYKMEKEPAVRIGIVLAEDGKQRVEFQTPAGGYRIDNGVEAKGVAPNELMAVEAEGDLVKFSGGGQAVEALRLLPPDGAEPQKAGDGVLVKGIVAGRGFHWHKLIDQALSHVLEFRARDGNVILVNELPLETYLIGVITGEMSNECPIEFMKAQAVAARSWLLAQTGMKHPGEPFLWCNDDCCQRYQGTGGWSEQARQAIAQCRGEVLITESNRYCDARYSKSTGGFSEDAEFIWGEKLEGLESMLDAPEGSEAQRFSPLDDNNIEEFLRGDWLASTDIYCSPNVVPEETITRYLGRVDEAGSYFRWTKEVTQESLKESLAKRGGITGIGEVHELCPGPRGKSGRQEFLTVVYTDTEGNPKGKRIYSDYNIRAAMSMDFLFSSCFVVESENDDEGVLTRATLYGGGWGHGSGLCQIGGLGRALKGQAHGQILLAYYTKVKLERIYD